MIWKSIEIRISTSNVRNMRNIQSVVRRQRLTFNWEKQKNKTEYVLQQFKNIYYVTHHSRTRNSIKNIKFWFNRFKGIKTFKDCG